MENADTPSEIKQNEDVKSPEKPTESVKTTEVEEKLEEEKSDKPDATETSENKPTQNGETEATEESKTPDSLENNDETTKPQVKPVEENNTDTNNKPPDKPVEENNIDTNDKPPDKPVKITRGTKRKAANNIENEAASGTKETETVEQKENVDSKNDDNVQKENDLSEDASMRSVSDSLIMGKGKRARIPNKRYSDILLSPNRKSMGNPKPPDSVDFPEITIKEEPLDSPVVGGVSSPSLPTKKARSSQVKENLQDPKYLKPFKFGWKRELVWRSTSTAIKPLGDIYYYTPSGKKVRSFREVSDHLTGKNLTLENFSFTKEPLGIDDTEKEIIREAKIKSSESFSESPQVKKPEVKKPEVKKPEVKKTLVKKVLSPKSGGAASPKRVAARAASPKVDTPPVTKKKAEPAVVKETPPPKVTPKKPPPRMPLRKTRTPPAKKAKLTAKETKEETPKKIDSPPPPPPVTRSGSSPNKVTSKQPCSIMCDGMQGIVPTLQCRLCLCLYHHECVGLSHDIAFPYVCKNCHDQSQSSPSSVVPTLSAPPPLTPINTLKSVTLPTPLSLPKLQRIPRPDSSDPIPVLPAPLHEMPPLLEGPPNIQDGLVSDRTAQMPKLTPKPSNLLEAGAVEGANKGLVGAVTTWLPHNSKIVHCEDTTEAPRPQYVEFLGKRKFLIIPKHNFMSVSSGRHVIPRTEESTIAPSAPQPPEIPSAPASVGSDGSPPGEPQPKDQAVCEEIIDIASDDTEIKKEPLSPIKAEEKQSAATPMEVDDVKEDGDGVEGTEKIKEDDVVKETEDEATQNSVSKVNTKKRNLKVKSITNTNSITVEEKNEAKFMENYMQNLSFGATTSEEADGKFHIKTRLTLDKVKITLDLGKWRTSHVPQTAFSYFDLQGCVCTMWRDIASHPILWRTVRMKNSQVHSFEGLANTLKKHGTVHLDLRKMLLPSNGDEIWPEFSKAIAQVDTLKKIELCRCPASVVEQLAASNPTLQIINAVTIKCDNMDLDPLKSLTNIKELRLKSTSGLNINSIDSLKELKTLKILSLTSVNELHKLDLSVIADLTNLESLDLGECTEFPKNFGQDILAKLEKLEKLRLEKGQGNCHTFEILEAVKHMKKMEQLELVNFDVKAGFDKAIGSCTNIRKLMIIPTYISQSATTNNMVLAGVLRLQGSLTHFVWGVTLELLRVTELFVDQCEDSNKKEKKPTGNGDSIPVLKPVPDLTHGGDIQTASNPPQVEILPLPNLQKLLLNSLPTTRVKILKIPFHATWRQTLTDSV